MREPAPPTLRVTDGRHGKVDVPMVRSRALQSWVEEIRVPPVDIAAMYYIPFFMFLLYVFVMVCCLNIEVRIFPMMV